MKTIDFIKRSDQKKTAKDKAAELHQLIVKASQSPAVADFAADPELIKQLEGIFFEAEILQEKTERNEK